MESARRIIIQNFGALEKVDINLDKSISVIIGRQASGKSTLGKAIYFCKKIRDYLCDYANEILIEKYDSEYFINFLKYLRQPFMGCFGTTKHMERFQIKYYYDIKGDKYVEISLDDAGYALFQFSTSMKAQIKKLIDDAVSITKKNTDYFSTRFTHLSLFMETFRKQAKIVFSDDDRLIFIPAGRNLLAIIPDLILQDVSHSSVTRDNVDISHIDLITQDFVRYIQVMKSRFGSRLNEVTENYLKTVRGQIRNRDVEMACDLIRNIIRADYVYDKEGEKLFYKDDRWVKLMFSSSGQQEVLWALNCFYLAILQKEKTYFVFEEPESHLFPDAQEQIAKLATLAVNSCDCSVFLTTHSPYMLTALNLLIFSGQVERSADFEPIVERQYRINNDDISAYMICDGKKGNILRDIIGEDRKLIDALEIDGVSEKINMRMDRLLDIKVQRGSKR